MLPPHSLSASPSLCAHCIDAVTSPGGDVTGAPASSSSFAKDAEERRRRAILTAPGGARTRGPAARTGTSGTQRRRVRGGRWVGEEERLEEEGGFFLRGRALRWRGVGSVGSG